MELIIKSKYTYIYKEINLLMIFTCSFIHLKTNNIRICFPSETIQLHISNTFSYRIVMMTKIQIIISNKCNFILMKTDHLTIEHQSNELELKKLKNLVDYLLGKWKEVSRIKLMILSYSFEIV